MTVETCASVIESALLDVDIIPVRIEERFFPEERWLVVFVDPTDLPTAQLSAGDIENRLNGEIKGDGASFAVTFRAASPPINQSEDTEPDVNRSPLMGVKVDQLIKLLEARSRTSDALPSLRYVEDPRASLAAATATRHQIIYGRRGVGKTALLVESKRLAEREGSMTTWINAQVLKGFTPETAFLFLAESVVETILRHLGSTSSTAAESMRADLEKVRSLRDSATATETTVRAIAANLNSSLRRILRHEVNQLVVFIDDFYLYSAERHAKFLDLLAGTLRDCNGWIKVASIERLTRPFEPSSRVGLEMPHDATKIDLDVTLEDPGAAQRFLETVLSHYTDSAGIRRVGAIANAESLGRLVLASGGVPRDYLNFFGASIVVARERTKSREIGKEDVAVASGSSTRSRKRDLELDVSSSESAMLLDANERLSESIQSAGFTYFRVNFSQKMMNGYEVLSRLVDLRFAHLIQSTLSDKHSSGTKYEVYVLALSEYTDVRLKRGLQVLDIENGHWTHRQSGKANTTTSLAKGVAFRDQLRLAPIVNLEKMVPGGPRDVLYGQDVE